MTGDLFHHLIAQAMPIVRKDHHEPFFRYHCDREWIVRPSFHVDGFNAECAAVFLNRLVEQVVLKDEHAVE